MSAAAADTGAAGDTVTWVSMMGGGGRDSHLTKEKKKKKKRRKEKDFKFNFQVLVLLATATSCASSLSWSTGGLIVRRC